MKAGGIFIRVMLVLVFLALVANLALWLVTGETSVGVEFLKNFIYGSIVVADLLLVGAGVYFTTATIHRHPRSHLEWARRGFLANGIIAVLLGLSPWIASGEDLSREMLNAGVYLAALGVSTALFTYAAYREFSRLRGATERSRRATREGPGPA